MSAIPYDTPEESWEDYEGRGAAGCPDGRAGSS